MHEAEKIKRAVEAAFAFLGHCAAQIVLLPFYLFMAVFRGVRALLEPEQRSLRIALILSLLLHLALIAVLTYLAVKFRDEAGKNRWIDLDILDRKKEEAAKTPEEELARYRPRDEIPEGQVVEAPPSSDRRRPDNARFLAERDGRVARETRARSLGRPAGPGAASLQIVGKKPEQRTARSGVPAEQEGPPAPDQPRPGIAGGAGDAVLGKLGPRPLDQVDLQPSAGAISAALAGSGLDHLEGMADGDVTALNTVGWKYAGFFNRVKRMVENYWRPEIEYNRRDPYGNIYGFKDRTTVLLVVLYSDGRLKQIYVMSPSGASFLDDEARDAVARAAPFPEVPPGLVDKRDGLVKFTFHFLVEVGAQPVLRMRRYQ